MTLRATPVLAAVLVFAATAGLPAAAQPRPVPVLEGVTVEQVLRHAALAPQIVDYEGTKILSVLRGETMETVTVNEAHKRPSRTRLDFLSPEGVAGRIIIIDGTRTWHYEPRLHTVFIGPSLAAPPDAPTALPVDRYDVSLLGGEEVIGRQTVVVRLRPRDGVRERRLWIDRTTGVPLRTEDREPAAGLVATSYFTRISFALNVPAALFQPRLPAGARVVGQPAAPEALLPVPILERRLGFRVPAPASLPGGFTLLGGLPVRDGPVVAARLQYSDGIRPLTLFAVPASRLGPPGRGDPVAELGAESRTLLVGVLRLVLWTASGYRLTLVGPLALEELVTVARAVGQAVP